MKLYALPSLYRQGEFARADIYEGDVLALLRGYAIDEDLLVDMLVREMLPSDIAAIRDIVREVRTRITKSEKRGAELSEPNSEIQNPKSKID